MQADYFSEKLSMKKRKLIDILFGLILIGLGLHFNNWLGFLGLMPFLMRAVDWLHGLFTHHEMHLQ